MGACVTPQPAPAGPRRGYVIREAWFLAPDIKLFRIEAPRVAAKQRAGQFVIVRLHERGERIPLTIAASDDTGAITLVVQGIGKTTRLMNRLSAGDAIQDVVGPLGQPSHIERFGTVMVIGGGVGTAIAWPTAKAMATAGNTVLGIIGARSTEHIILEDEMRQVTERLWITTDDGSNGTRGLVTDQLEARLAEGVHLDLVLAIGPIPMMRAVAEVTRPHGIRTIVSLNPIMVDGTGMCGGCRVQVGGQSRFACVDGPEFDAHQVDFGILATRNAMYHGAEKKSLDAFEHDPRRDLALARSLGPAAAAQALEARLDEVGTD